jgi:hypothetical protein
VRRYTGFVGTKNWGRLKVAGRTALNRCIENIHARLLRDDSPTFSAALENQTKLDSLQELFAKFQAWLAAP